jgi:3-oxoacyl-[acyl-carrier-protein] synthase-3
MIGRRLIPSTGIAIAGTASVPEACGRLVSNEEVDRTVAGNGGRIAERDWLGRTGLQTRRWTAEPGGGSFKDSLRTDELLTIATERALLQAGIPHSEVDVLVTSTTTPSRYTSAMATLVSGRLGITGMALDVRAGCPSALHALVVAAAQIQSGASVAVVVAAETLSGVAPGVGPLAYLVGDATAAVVLTASSDSARGLLGGWVGNDGSVAELVGTPGAMPPDPRAGDGEYRLRFEDGYDEVARAAWDSIGHATLTSAGIEPHTVGAFVSNQPGRQRVISAAEQAGVHSDRVIDVVGTTANAGSASFLVALDAAHRQQSTSDAPWLLVSVGGGLSYIGVVISP